ncbi:MAG: hypothetical protein WCC84_03630 [Candidatus Cybelea sp.]
MRKQSLFLTAATAVISAALLAACSGAASQGTGAGLPSSSGVSQSKGLFDPVRSGVAPKFLGDVGHPHATKQHGVSPANYGRRHIFVTDFGTGAVDIVKYNSWAAQGSFTAGLNGADGDWVDKASKDVYVANYAGPYVTEYDESGNLLYTYSAGMADAVDVTTDKLGNVYEADFNYTVQGGGFVNEYAHMSNTVVASCSPGGNVEGVAVDKHGNVFVAYNNLSSDVGSIAEYVGGLAGCNGTVLPITFGYLGGIALDKITGNLIVCDQTGPSFSGAVVDVVGYPSYSSVTGTLGSGYSDPFHVTIDMANDKAYVADLSQGVVQVLNYPAGTNITTLGSANGITQAASAVDTHNSVVNN